jgi:hypothetical protein
MPPIPVSITTEQASKSYQCPKRLTYAVPAEIFHGFAPIEGLLLKQVISCRVLHNELVRIAELCIESLPMIRERLKTKTGLSGHQKKWGCGGKREIVT